jgi:hypothetical protein
MVDGAIAGIWRPIDETLGFDRNPSPPRALITLIFLENYFPRRHLCRSEITRLLVEMGLSEPRRKPGGDEPASFPELHEGP